LLLYLTACGRFGFDTRTQTGDSGAIDAPTGDAARDAASDTAADGTASSIVMMQASTAIEGNGTQTIMLASPTTSGTLLVATIGVNSSTALTLPNGWANNATSSVSGACVSVFATEISGVAGRQAFTFTMAMSGPIAVQVSEWAGVDLSNPFDASGMGGASSATTSLSISTSGATTAPGDLAIGTFCQDVNAPMFFAGAGWTELGQVPGASATPSLFSEYQRGVPVAQVTATGTTTGSAKSAATIVTFRSK
jgi:hypothetical protein